VKRISLVAELTLVIGLLAIPGVSCKTGSGIEDKEWVLESFSESGSLVAPIAGTVITLTFDTLKNQIQGSTGCNSYFGEYKITNTTLSIDQLGHTEMYCMDPEGTMDQETNYLGVLINTKSYSMKDGKLQIEGGEQTLTFVTRENLPSTTMPPLNGGRSAIGVEISCDEFASERHIAKK
jgi:heat shock protein HslJ